MFTYYGPTTPPDHGDAARDDAAWDERMSRRECGCETPHADQGHFVCDACGADELEEHGSWCHECGACRCDACGLCPHMLCARSKDIECTAGGLRFTDPRWDSWWCSPHERSTELLLALYADWGDPRVSCRPRVAFRESCAVAVEAMRGAA